jgi:hypothetical protein
MPIHTELKADFNGVQNPYPLTPNDAFVSSINDTQNGGRVVDWSSDLSSWNGDTGELSVVQRQVTTQNGTIDLDFIKGYPVSTPIDGNATGVIYDTNDTVNFDFTSSSDNPNISTATEKDSLVKEQRVRFEIESNRTGVPSSPQPSDRYIQVELRISPLGSDVVLRVKNTDSNTVTDTVSIPQGFFDTVDIQSSGTVSLTFDNSTADSVKVNAFDIGSESILGTLTADVSTNGLPSNPNTLIGYYAEGINRQGE